MNFSKSIQRAYNTKWSYINTFDVHFMFGVNPIIQNIWKGVDARDMGLYVKAINTPPFVNTPIEAYVGNQYKIHNGKCELYRFTVTFRDFDQLNLYKRFILNYSAQRTTYFDECKMTINLLKESDHVNERDKWLFNYEGCLIESVSQLQFSNETETQIVEFDVMFKCVTASVVQ